MLAPLKLVDPTEVAAYNNEPERKERRASFDGHRGVGEAHSLGARSDLLDRLLARDVGDADAFQGCAAGDVEQQGRLAHPGIAAQQDRRAGYHPAPADAVELAEDRHPRVVEHEVETAAGLHDELIGEGGRPRLGAEALCAYLASLGGTELAERVAAFRAV